MANLPCGWSIKPLEQLVEPARPIVYGIVQAGPEHPLGIPYIKSTNVGGRIDVGTLAHTSPEIAKKYKRSVVRPGDVVFSLRGNIGELSLVPSNLPEANLTQGTARIAPNTSILNTFIAAALQAPAIQKRIATVAKGSTFQEISLEQLRKLEVPVPPLPEQRKIAEILRTWDEAIEKLVALRAAKEKLASAIADDLIFGVRRVAGYQEPWASRRLAEITRELTQRNREQTIGRDYVMGVTNSRGIVPMREQTIAADISRYLILPPRAFAYNPMRINVGSIAMSRFEHDVLVSPDYVLFECLPGKLDPDFLDHLRQSHFWSHYINAGGTGSVRMRTYYDDLAALRLKMPSHDEQLAISKVLNAAKDEVRLIRERTDALALQKRGLMQKLLTGEWRVST